MNNKSGNMIIGQYLKKQQTTNNHSLKMTVILGLSIRLLALLFILTIGQSFSIPYYIIDDRNYELLAQRYMQQAQSIIDISTLTSIGALSYLEIFWPCLVCISAKALGFLYAGRIINCIFSTACIVVIYHIVSLLTQSEKTRLLSCRLFAFLPLSVLVCCFPIKDIFLMYAVLRVFFIIQMWHDDKKISIYSIAWTALLLIGISRSRGAIIEFLLIVACFIALHKFFNKGQYLSVFAFSIILLIGIFLLGNEIMNSFMTKIEDYSGVTETGNRITYIQMRNPMEIYKLPFSYFYATLQPFLLDYFSIGRLSIWVYIMGILNISIYPIAIGNYAYIFMKKHSFILWITTAVLFAAISSLSLGNSRHYLFCLPYTIINCSLVLETEKRWVRQIISCGSVAIFTLILVLSFYNV